jgi:hypothetical protein
MYLVASFGAASLALGAAGDAIPVLAAVLLPIAGLCAVLFVLALIGPAERLFPLSGLPRRAAPVLWDWVLYFVKGLLFFGGISAFLYFVLRLLR